jgi:SAM-dependent methyltransferase
VLKLEDLVSRSSPQPWSGATKIPWADPGFSERMLREHLCQEHDRASRSFATIDRQVEWLHSVVLGGAPGNILDLGCGPGLYTSRLARYGHRCVGIDISPASIAHARAEAQANKLCCEYRLADLRDDHWGGDFGGILLLFGEFNTFPPAEAERLLRRAHAALAPGGALVLEIHPDAHVRGVGEDRATWAFRPPGLFSSRPHLVLRESAWHPDERAATERYFVLHSGADGVDEYANTLQAWTDAQYESLLNSAGFTAPERYASLEGGPSGSADELFVIVCRKNEV